MNVNKVAFRAWKQNQMQQKLTTVSSVTKREYKNIKKFYFNLSKKGLMTSFGDKFIAIDTWLIANFDLDILKRCFEENI